MVAGSIASEKVAVTATPVAPFAGVVDDTVGAVVSGDGPLLPPPPPPHPAIKTASSNAINHAVNCLFICVSFVLFFILKTMVGENIGRIYTLFLKSTGAEQAFASLSPRNLGSASAIA